MAKVTRRNGEVVDRYLLNQQNWTMDAREIIEAVFPGKGYGTRVPADVFGECVVDGVNLVYQTTDGAKLFWKGKRGMYMRALAECPKCQKWFAASRINQHAVVHDREG